MSRSLVPWELSRVDWGSHLSSWGTAPGHREGQSPVSHTEMTQDHSGSNDVTPSLAQW